ncbi:Gag Polyprotein [Phytophthora megakarya]|uniref:Gag Polyprotein n=1 Tax=Phytophthora megakarya TaxID=4795 RepID=A0A225VJ63_9STRA|nr:Gag Polyprotein [Phytophthora megakarya]
MDWGEFTHLNHSQFEFVGNMAGSFGRDGLLSLAAVTPAEQVERIPRAVKPKPLKLKIPAFEGKEGSNLLDPR